MASGRKSGGITLFFQIVLILCLTLFLIGVLARELAGTEVALRREAAARTALTETVSAVGYILRDEVVATSIDGGPVRYAATDGTAVTAGALLAEVYADSSNTGTRARAAEITAEIERLQALDQAAPPPDYYGAYATLMASLSAGRIANTAASAAVLDSALDLAAARTEDAAARRAQIAALQAEFESLVENDLNASDTVTATASGVFYREVDGYESVLSTAAVEALTPGGLRALLASPQKSDGAIGKVVTGGTWYLAVPLGETAAAGFTVGERYAACITRTGEEMTLELVRVTAADTEGELLLVLKAEGVALPCDLARAQEVVLRTGTSEGISVPMTALREQDGAYGVFVEESGVAVWRSVEPVLLQNGICLATLTEREGYLREGELILVTPRRIYDGKALS